MTDPRPWTYRHFAHDTGPETFGPFEPVVALWQARALGRPVPRWGDLEFSEFAGWHDMMVVDEIFYEPFDSRTLIWGSRLAEIAGYQPRGLLFSESRGIRGLLDDDFDFLERVCREASIGLTSGQLDWRGRQHITIERIYLPFAEAGKAPADRVASFCRVVDRGR